MGTDLSGFYSLLPDSLTGQSSRQGRCMLALTSGRNVRAVGMVIHTGLNMLSL